MKIFFVHSNNRLAHVAVLGVLAGAIVSAESINFSKLPATVINHRLEQVTNENKAREASLKKLFEQAGCTADHLIEQEIKGSDVPNLICTLPGETDSVVVVGAHFDAAPNTEGVVNNWSGAALLPSLYQSINKTPRHHSFVFIGFSSKEKDLKGSQSYVRSLGKEAGDKVKAMVNLDCLGLSSTKVWATDDNKTLTGYIAGVAQAVKLPVTGLNLKEVGQGDAIPFNKQNIPTLVVHSLTTDNYKILHTPQDTLAAVNRDEYYRTYSLLTAYLAFLDIKLQ